MADDPNVQGGFFARLRSRLMRDSETDGGPDPDDPGGPPAGGDDLGGAADTGGIVQEDPANDGATIGTPPPEPSPSADAGNTATASGPAADDLVARFDLQATPPPGPGSGPTDAGFISTNLEQVPLGNALPDVTIPEPEPELPLDTGDPPIDFGPDATEGDLPA